MSNAAAVAAQWWADRLGQPNAVRDRFKEYLQSSIGQKMVLGERVKISTDYDPDEMLTNALAAAGVAIPRITCDTCYKVGLPYKTRMFVQPDWLEVSEGRGAPYETINVTQEKESA